MVRSVQKLVDIFIDTLVVLWTCIFFC